MNPKVRDIIMDLKTYLEYLKVIGIEALPFSETKVADQFPNTSLPSPSLETLEEIRRELGECHRCKLHRTRRTLVFGEGRRKSEVDVCWRRPRV